MTNRERENDWEWLQSGIEQDPNGWEALYVSELGREGALDLLALQAGRIHEVNLTRRPFASNPELKALVRAARTASHELRAEAFALGFRIIDRARSRAKLETEES